MKKFLFFFLALIFFFTLAPLAKAQTAPDAKDKAKPSDAAAAKAQPTAPLPFWVVTLPKVTGNVEDRYDINRDGILQTSETKILLRDVLAEVEKSSSYNIADSALLKAYDKNKDGIISKLEAEDIKKDLVY